MKNVKATPDLKDVSNLNLSFASALIEAKKRAKKKSKECGPNPEKFEHCVKKLKQKKAFIEEIIQEALAHPLDRKVESMFSGIMTEENNYHQQVRSALHNIIESQASVSEKDFHRQDGVMAIADRACRLPAAGNLIGRFEVNGSRPQLCAEVLFSKLKFSSGLDETIKKLAGTGPLSKARDDLSAICEKQAIKQKAQGTLNQEDGGLKGTATKKQTTTKVKLEGRRQASVRKAAGEFIEITAPINSSDVNLFTNIVNQGIDSHLEGFTRSKFEWKDIDGQKRLVMKFHKSELNLLVRRLEEVGSEEADLWAIDIRDLPEFSEKENNLKSATKQKTRVTLAQDESFLKMYIRTMLWAETGDDDQPLESKYGLQDLSPEALQKIKDDCLEFQQKAGELLEGEDLENAGHDFWLTRNGHGAGFWDGDWAEKGDALTAISKQFGEIWIYEGDDGKLHLSGGRKQASVRVKKLAGEDWVVTDTIKNVTIEVLDEITKRSGEGVISAVGNKINASLFPVGDRFIPLEISLYEGTYEPGKVVVTAYFSQQGSKFPIPVQPSRPDMNGVSIVDAIEEGFMELVNGG